MIIFSYFEFSFLRALMEGKMPWSWFSVYVSLCRYGTLSACVIGLCFGMESLVYNITLCEYIEKIF